MKNVSKTFSGFTPLCDYKHTKAKHADNPGVYTSDKSLSLSPINQTHLMANVERRSIVGGSRQPILFSFVLGKPLEYKIFLETIHFRKLLNLF